jgi:hypothetical protein
MKRRKDEIRLADMLVSEQPGIDIAEIDPDLTLSVPMRAARSGNSELP